MPRRRPNRRGETKRPDTDQTCASNCITPRPPQSSPRAGGYAGIMHPCLPRAFWRAIMYLKNRPSIWACLFCLPKMRFESPPEHHFKAGFRKNLG